jgi:hypothetical protein
MCFISFLHKNSKFEMSGEPQQHRTQTSISSDNTLLIDSPDCIMPSHQDILLTDITPSAISSISKILKTPYLEPAIFPNSLPVAGLIWKPNSRLMVNLVCRRVSDLYTSKRYPAINVLFVIDTASPNTFLSAAAIRALDGMDGNGDIPDSLNVDIQIKNSIRVSLSPLNSRFSDVNVLGIDYLMENRMFPVLDFTTKKFLLDRTS